MHIKKNDILRIEQRERIISCIIGNGDIYSTEPRNKMCKNHYIEIKDNDIKKINLKKELLNIPWLNKGKQEIIKNQKYTILRSYDFKKLRIFSKWFYRYDYQKRYKTLKQIIQYFYTNLPFKILYLDNGKCINNNTLYIKLNNYRNIEDAYLLCGYLFRYFDIKGYVNVKDNTIKMEYLKYINENMFFEAVMRIKQKKYGVDISSKKHNINTNVLQKYYENDFNYFVETFNTRTDIPYSTEHDFYIVFEGENFNKIKNLIK